MVDMIHIEQCQDIISHPTICSVLPELRTKPPKELALKRSTGANLARTITANYGSCCGFGWLWGGGACSALCFVMWCSVVFCCEEVPVLLLLNRRRYKTSTTTSKVKGGKVPVLVLPN